METNEVHQVSSSSTYEGKSGSLEVKVYTKFENGRLISRSFGLTKILKNKDWDESDPHIYFSEEDIEHLDKLLAYAKKIFNDASKNQK